MHKLAIGASFVFVVGACQGQEGLPGAAGANGRNADGTVAGGGTDGTPGGNGANGTTGTTGPAGPVGPAGPAATNPSTEASGARIKARYTTYTYAGADGANQTIKAFGGWFDSQRSEACAVSLASDGTSRCLPTVGATASGYCSDAACTKPAVAIPTGAAVPTYLRTSVTLAGGTGTRISTPGAKLALATWYYNFGPTSCLAVGAPPAGNDIYDASTAEIPPSDFVAFTVTTQTL